MMMTRDGGGEKEILIPFLRRMLVELLINFPFSNLNILNFLYLFILIK